ncbi:nucleotidyltransferase family protein [Robiginitomaculum antarcticum]|uniref:nucleotidyltransferase family protein n=1 Tax=Robiginitomaculum antarcticum TaxID=437507 RepID=UPI00037419EF|nr:nucleotidyltransferase family protein [Robiginitomaculum antarcticum]
MSKTAPIKTAMIMAAGQGTRMAPLTDERSKAMVTLGGKPLIDHMLDRLGEAGIKRAVINVHAHADQLEEHVLSHAYGPDIIISDERDALLETGGGVVNALSLLGDDPFLICNIDAIWVQRENLIKKLISYWTDEMDELLMLTRRQYAFGYNGPGDFHTDFDLRLTRRWQAVAPEMYAGVQICRPHVFDGFKAEKFSRNKVWDKSLDRGKLYGVNVFSKDGFEGEKLDGYWLHVGDPQARDIAEAILADPDNPWTAIGHGNG